MNRFILFIFITVLTLTSAVKLSDKTAETTKNTSSTDSQYYDDDIVSTVEAGSDIEHEQKESSSQEESTDLHKSNIPSETPNNPKNTSGIQTNESETTNEKIDNIGGIPVNNKEFNLRLVVDKLINEKVFFVNGIDLAFKQPLNEDEIYTLFGPPSEITELSDLNFEYTDYRIGYYEKQLNSVAYFNLNINENEVLEVLGNPYSLTEKNQYNQRVLLYTVYFHDVQDLEEYITLYFAFDNHGTLEYFTIN
ncbi:hypothetical protein [Sporosarcina sp. FA9]|uniref:hypothetical protein n=1 Tax=Sporosarcina sp. FA9 TaxID=3413030 RepID=UPI003F65C944